MQLVAGRRMTDASPLDGPRLRPTERLAFRLQVDALQDPVVLAAAALSQRICHLEQDAPLPEVFLRRAAGDDVIDHWLKQGLMVPVE